MQKQPRVCAGTSAKEAFFNNANWSGRRRRAARHSLVLVASAAALTVAQSLLPSPSAQAATIYWDAAPGSAPWTTNTNWNTSGTADTPDPAAAPGTNDIAEFNRVTATQPTFSTASAITVGAIWLTGAVGNTTIVNTNGTSAFNFTGGQTVNGTSNVGIWIDDNLNKNLQVGATGTSAWNGTVQNNQTWFVGTGDALTLNAGTAAGSININGKTLTIDGGGNTNLGRINNPVGQTTGTIIKKGSGLFANSGGFNGTITQVQLNGGTFELSTNWNASKVTATNGFDFTGDATLWIGNNGGNGAAIDDLSGKIKIEDGVTGTIDAGTGNTVTTYATAFQVGTLATGAFTKAGSSTLTISAANTYKGATTVAAGTLALSSASNNIASSGAITAGSSAATAATLDITGITGGFALASGQALGGFRTVNGPLTIAAGSKLSAGTGTASTLGTTTGTGATDVTGTLTTQNGASTTVGQTWAKGGAYVAKINETNGTGTGVAGTGAAGSSTGWDLVSMNALALSGLGGGAGNTFAISLTSPGGKIGDFDRTKNYTWEIASITNGTPFTPGVYLATAGPTGASTGTTTSSLFTLDTSAFVGAPGSNSTGSGSSFYLEAINSGGGQYLEIGYNATPEPGGGILVLAGVIPMLASRRKRRAVVEQSRGAG